MRLLKVQKRANAAVVLVAAFTLLVGASPAHAAEVIVGEGAGNGFGVLGGGGGPCPDNAPPAGFEFTSGNYDLSGPATYEAAEAPDAAVAAFAGVVDIEIAMGRNVQAPQGTAPACQGPILVPTPVDLTNVDINGTTTVSPTTEVHVECDNLIEGTYLRINTTVVFDFVVECDVVTTVSGVITQQVLDVPARHVLSGNENACNIGPVTNPECLLNPNADSHVVYTFVAEGAQ